MYTLIFPTALLFSLFLIAVNAHTSEFNVSPSLFGAEINIRVEEGPQETYAKKKSGLEKRQNCGAGVGTCPPGQCCSSGGQCGIGTTFCNGPACQLAYGPACDGNTSPPGASTLGIARTKVGNVAYGTVLYHCKTPGTIAITFDDGPYTYTQSILDTLAKYNFQATFFINGNSLGKGRIDDPSTPWPQILRNMYKAGHQLASHTWSHQDLTLLPPNLMQNQIIYNEMSFRNIFGFFPTYIRPPYGFCSGPSGCSDYLNSLGYHIINWDIDTKDYLNDDPALILNSERYFSGNISSTAGGNSYITLAHDTHQNTALTLVGYMLDLLKARGYKAVTVGECMGDPRENWYRDAGGVPSSMTSSTVAATKSSTTPSSISERVMVTTTTSSSTSGKMTATATQATSSNTNKSLSSAVGANPPALSAVTAGTTLDRGSANVTGGIVTQTSTSKSGAYRFRAPLLLPFALICWLLAIYLDILL